MPPRSRRCRGSVRCAGAVGDVVAPLVGQLAAAPDLLVEDRREFNQIGHIHTPLCCAGVAQTAQNERPHDYKNLCQRYVVQLKAVANVARDRILKGRAAVQKANLVELEQGRARFGVQALGFFLGCCHGANGTVEARDLQPTLLADKAVDRSVQVLLFKARNQLCLLYTSPSPRD